MEPSNRQRLHPLIAAAAISVISVSAVGVAALTGVLPRTSASSAAPSSAMANAPAAPAAAAVNDAAPTNAQPVVTPPTVNPPAAPATVTPKRHKPAVVRTRAPVEERRVDDAVVARDVAPSPAPAPAPLPPVAAAQNLGTVDSVREIAEPGEGTGLGAIAGGVLGGVLGSQFGHGNGRKILTVAGAAGGAYAGHQVEKQARSTKHWEITVRMDNGALRTLSTDSAPLWRAGDRVRVVNGRLEAV